MELLNGGTFNRRRRTWTVTSFTMVGEPGLTCVQFVADAADKVFV